MKKKALLMFITFAALVLTLAGCTQAPNTSAGQKGVTYYIPLTAQKYNDEVFEKINELAQEKIGVKVNFIPVEFANYEQKMQVVNAGGEAYDIAFTSNWLNNYNQNVAKEVFQPLDDLLPKLAPKTFASMDASMWDGVRVNGKIYGVINQQIIARAPAVMVPKRTAGLLGMEEQLASAKSLYDLEYYLRQVKQATGKHSYFDSYWKENYQAFGFEEIVGSNLPGAIYFKNGDLKVVNQYETDEFKNYIDTRRRWVAEGLTQSVQYEYKNLEQYTAQSEGIIPVLSGVSTYKPGVEAETLASLKFDPVIVAKTEPLMSTSGLTATLTAVAALSKNPEAAVQFIELLNTDKEICNLLSFGIEGTNYNKVGENRAEQTATPFFSAPWAYGCVFNCYLLPGQADDTWQETKQINDDAIRSPLLGFVPNLEEIRLEMGNCKNVIDEYFLILDQGLAESDETYNEFLAKLKSAGSDKILGKLQAQVDQWKKGGSR